MVQTTERLSTDSERYLLVFMIVVLILITTLVISFFIVFTRRKNKILIDKMKQQQAFEEELAQSQIETQEETLKNIGRELHDNVGQLLSFTNMQLSLISTLATDEIKGKVEDTKKVVSDTIAEVRSLSKSLNNDVISNFGLIKSLQNEENRINKLDTLKIDLNIQDGFAIQDKQHELILYRIIQEFISNSIKYSDAEKVEIKLQKSENHLNVYCSDNGKGFDSSKIEPGSGLINMTNRAKLINSKFELKSSPGNGVELSLQYPL